LFRCRITSQPLIWLLNLRADSNGKSSTAYATCHPVVRPVIPGPAAGRKGCWPGSGQRAVLLFSRAVVLRMDSTESGQQDITQSRAAQR
jgi:hypothetical protein